MKLIAVEFFKLRTQRVMRVLFILAIGLSLLGLILQIVSRRLRDEAVSGILTDPGMQSRLLDIDGGTIFVMILAILVATGEYRHKTMSWSLLGTPDRKRLIGGQLGLSLVVGLAYGVVIAIFTTAGVSVLLAQEGVPLVLSWGDVAGGYIRDLGSYALYVGFGFGIGALLANQVAAIIVVFVEPLLSQIVMATLPNVGRFLPSQAANAFQNEPRLFGAESLSPAFAGVVFLGYVAVVMVFAVSVTHRRDIT